MLRSLSVLAILALSAPAWSAPYEMKDLEALEKQESWQEILNHLEDVPPSKRNDAWTRIAEKSGAGVLNAIDPSKEGDHGRYGKLQPPHAVALADAMLKQYPVLKKSKVFMAARADNGLKGFKYTYSNSSHNAGDDPWRDQLKEFAASDPLTADLQFRSGKLVASRLVAYVALPFFKAALNGTPGAAACKDADVKKSIVGALADGVWAEDAKALGEKCFADVKADLEKELSGPDGDKLDKAKQNVCPVFAAKKVTLAACKK
jgi:hypothetical protein